MGTQMGVKLRMRAFVRERLSGLTNNEICFLTDIILDSIGYVQKSWTSISEAKRYENHFKKKFFEVFNGRDIMTRYEFFLIKKMIEAESIVLKA